MFSCLLDKVSALTFSTRPCIIMWLTLLSANKLPSTIWSWVFCIQMTHCLYFLWYSCAVESGGWCVIQHFQGYGFERGNYINRSNCWEHHPHSLFMTGVPCFSCHTVAKVHGWVPSSETPLAKGFHTPQLRTTPMSSQPRVSHRLCDLCCYWIKDKLLPLPSPASLAAHRCYSLAPPIQLGKNLCLGPFKSKSNPGQQQVNAEFQPMCPAL